MNESPLKRSGFSGEIINTPNATFWDGEIKMAKIGYDLRCRDVAEIFLGDDIIAYNHGERIDELASLIQQTIENWINANPPRSGRK